MAANKRVGKKSLAQNDFLQPAAPVNVVATDVGTARPFDNGAATVTFSLPAGSPPATSYTARAFCSRHQVFHSATGASSPLTVTGFGSDIDAVFTVTATNDKGTSAASAEAASIKITTVPATPAKPTVSSPSAGSDSVSWTAPANGGKAITNYRWTSSDGKAGNTASTSVSVNQEQGTAQTYNVYATNANGNSATSPNSNSVTTAFAFFGVFSFFGVFGFYYYNFIHFSVGSNTQILTVADGYKKAFDIQVGDELVAVDLSSTKTTDSWLDWSITDPSILDGELTTTTVTAKDVRMQTEYIYIDGELFTGGHFILTRKDGIISFTDVEILDTTYEKYSYTDRAFVPINVVDNVEIAMEKISIQCEPHDNFFTDQMLVLDQPDEYLARMNNQSS
jgi:hypothetical protein